MKNTLEWKKWSEQKPDDDSVCLVTNVDYGHEIFIAIYHSRYNVFIKYDLSDRKTTPLAITHWLGIPTQPCSSIE